MYSFLVVVHFIIAVLLMVIILMQAGRGSGLGGIFGGSGSESIFGARASDVLVKGTVLFTVLFFITSSALAILSAKRRTSVVDDTEVVEDMGTERTVQDIPGVREIKKVTETTETPLTGEKPFSPVREVAVPAGKPAKTVEKEEYVPPAVPSADDILREAETTKEGSSPERAGSTASENVEDVQPEPAP